jgi:CRISPR system Cascade subunit CasC
MFIELHILQNFAPSCLNRDDTNSPKDCEFGGYRRARVSSQCIKRAIRKHFAAADLLPPEHLAERSKRLVGAVAKVLTDKGRPVEAATQLVKAALASVKLATKEGDETQYLLFLGNREIAALADVVDRHWDALSGIEAPPADETASPPEGQGSKTKAAKPKTAKQKKSEAKEAVPADVAKQVKAVLDGGKAADLALFGRMLADQPDLNRDAACQVAHALSTNKVNMEMDFYTAVDDLKEREADPGAGMMGTVEFNSSCFYRYANIDLGQLAENLQGDQELALKTVQAFLRAAVEAIPTGKQNSMAAHNPPALVFAVVRDWGLWSLANAFVQPAWPTRKDSLVQRSIAELDKHWGKLTEVYGAEGIRGLAVCTTEDVALESLAAGKVGSFADLIRRVLELAQGSPDGKEAP